LYTQDYFYPKNMFKLHIPDNTIVRSVNFCSKILGASMRKWDTWCIGICTSLTGFDKERILAHEIWHCIDDSCGEDNKYSEQRAEEIACEMLVPKWKLKKVIEDGFTTIDEIRLFFPSATRDMIERSCQCIYQ